MNALEELVEADAIRKLRVRYAHAFDGNRMDVLADLFTDDAICEFGPDYGGDGVGKAEIRARFAQVAERHGPDYGVLHVVANHETRFLDAGNANGRAYLMTLRTTEGVENPLILIRHL